MALVSDVLQTRLELVGLGAYTSGLLDVADALEITGDGWSVGRRRLLGFGIAAGAASIALGYGLVRAAMAAGNEMASFSRASGNFKGSFPLSELETLAGGLSDLTGVDDGKIADTIGILGTFGLTKTEASGLILPILNATQALTALGMTSEQVGNMVGKALETGSATALRRVGIIIDPEAFKHADRATRLKMLIEALQRQGGDAALEFRKTLPGAMMAFQTSVSNAGEAIGKHLVTPLAGLINVGVGALIWFNNLPPAIHQAAAVLGVTLVAGLGLASVAMIGAALSTGRLAMSVLRLAEAHLMAAGAARVQAGSLQQLAGAAAISGGVTGGGVPVPGGKLGKFGKFGRMGFNVAAIAGTVAANYGLSKLPDKGFGSGAKDILGGALNGAMMGATIGSIIPGIGTGIGAGVGALAGGAYGTYEHMTKGRDPQQEELQKQTELLSKIADNTGKLPLGTSAVPGGVQAGIVKGLMRAV